ncbi:hypothetical protein FISHEDRAFT_75926 [Fistulina hepatica ATCC 64428]|uniref:Uncharacterized protein n=1 Tax=Fistulina hepatica ATCC 64428 TaxID=1128425 RepID=A0A0D7A819_9AGAR|nr:hypothetical protein FISHEDRAFT_48010 [Fistulina hepatica ATCC 64428]KIY46081.1 hypothetical protein FISHEDRAFT_75926 [Fistulina hepatica ATCC 64428]
MLPSIESESNPSSSTKDSTPKFSSPSLPLRLASRQIVRLCRLSFIISCGYVVYLILHLLCFPVVLLPNTIVALLTLGLYVALLRSMHKQMQVPPQLHTLVLSPYMFPCIAAACVLALLWTAVFVYGVALVTALRHSENYFMGITIFGADIAAGTLAIISAHLAAESIIERRARGLLYTSARQADEDLVHHLESYNLCVMSFIF